MPLMGLISISGIFGSKNEDLDILPPPPPFPDIGIDKKPKDAAEDEWKRSKQKMEEAVKPKKFGAKKEKIKIPKPIREIDKGRIELPKPEQKKPFFGKLFGKKDEELEKELEEIRKSIESMQREKKERSIGRLFRKKEKEKVMEKIETPEVMPRTFDKIDNIQEIEERIHKARLLLMDFRFEDAKRIYIEIMRRYNDSESKDRSKVYDDIRELYYERKSAERFARR